MANVLSAAGWDPRFAPSDEAFQQWQDALSPRRTMRPVAAGTVFLCVVLVWARFWPGRAIVAGLSVGALGFVVVMGLAIGNVRARGRAERRLVGEYESWKVSHVSHEG